jgi:hypothetical protein
MRDQDPHCLLDVESPANGEVPLSHELSVGAEITVEAWVSSDSWRSEALASLVSKWKPRDSFGPFAAFDAGRTDGLNSTGYFGAVFDGRYVYFSPEQHNSLEQHAVVLRYDTQGDFADAESYSAYDAQRTCGMLTKGFYGGVFDGQYVYFVPRQCDAEYHSRLLRHDPRLDFHDPAAWDAFDMGEAHSQQSAAFDGRFIYFCPGFSGDTATEDTLSSQVIRHDTHGDFNDPVAYTSVDISRFLGPRAACFDGGAFDGRYAYFVPLTTGMVVRCDSLGGFADRSSWQAFDARDVGMGMCVGAVFDGRFMYFVAYKGSDMVRFDTAGDFADRDSWESHDVAMTDGLDTGGFDGGYFDGRYVHFVPFVAESADGVKSIHANYLRYDTQGPFRRRESWQSADASHASGLYSVGYNGGAFDGRFFYAAPWRDNANRGQPGNAGVHGRVLRHDTLGTDGSFSLRYCDCGHSGGLCAAMPGPTFLINTERGALSAAAHQDIAPGRHHLAGVYDGRQIRLYVDGALVAERDGTGKIQSNRVPIVIGGIQGGEGRFPGSVLRARISSVARGAPWLEAAARG